MNKKLLYLLILVFLASCATSGRKNTEQLATLVKNGDLQSSIKLAKSNDFYPEERSRLLKLVELGTLYHLNHEYFQSLKTFEAAQVLSDQLFTVSLSKKVTSTILNDNFDNYYGEKYERSMIRFYQVLNHYMLYQTGNYEAYIFDEKDEKGAIVKSTPIPAKVLDQKEKHFHLIAARSVLLEWNSLLESYKAVSGGVATYKDDLLAKVVGGFIHEQIGSVEDRGIALNLYKAGKTLLFRNYNLFSTYNEFYKEFEKNFKDFGTMKEADVKEKFVRDTEHAKRLMQYLDGRIEALSKNKNENVFFLIEDGAIAPKTANKFDFELPVFMGAAAFEQMAFAIRILSTPVAGRPKIYFELPQIAFSPITDSEEIIIKDAAGALVKNINLAVINPLSELAYFTLEDSKVANIARTGIRVAAKHTAALIAAYQIYKSQKQSNDFLAMTLASVSYSIANKGIEASEAADIRYWSTLPNAFRMGSLKLDPGVYSIVLVRSVGTNKSEKVLGNITVTKDHPVSMFNFRAF
jgi:hypothetical protein